MFLSFQGGNLIFSMGGIWRPRPGEKPSLHEQEGLGVGTQQIRQQPCWGSSQPLALPPLCGPGFVAAQLTRQRSSPVRLALGVCVGGGPWPPRSSGQQREIPTACDLLVKRIKPGGGRELSGLLSGAHSLAGGLSVRKRGCKVVSQTQKQCDNLHPSIFYASSQFTELFSPVLVPFVLTMKIKLE